MARQCPLLAPCREKIDLYKEIAEKMKLKFKTQAYQTAAVQAVVDGFKGQPTATAEDISYRFNQGKAASATFCPCRPAASLVQSKEGVIVRH
jgi:hypothetical protein